MRVERYRKTRYWAVYEETGELLCVTVYRKGAAAVAERLGPVSTLHQSSIGQLQHAASVGMTPMEENVHA
jgi:hypothetical protein